MKQALEDLIEAVETAINAGDWKVDGACDPTLALVRAKEALAQPEQEPVAWIYESVCGNDFSTCIDPPSYAKNIRPLYTTPPQSKPLTLHGLSKIFASIPSIPFDGEWQLELVRAVEEAHGIKG